MQTATTETSEQPPLTQTDSTAFNWKPDIEGKYTVSASFGGSESYWPSHAINSIQR